MNYPFFWLKDGKPIPTRLVDENAEGLIVTVRSPDPYDLGEIEYTIETSKLQRAE